MAQPAPAPPLVKYRLFTEEHFKGNCVEINRWFQELAEAVNGVVGNHGPSKINNQLDMQGNRITNVGPGKITVG